MKIGDKPISEMTEAEMLEAIGVLQGEREALRADAIKRKREADSKGVEHKEPRAPRAPREKKVNEKDSIAANILAMMKEDDDD